MKNKYKKFIINAPGRLLTRFKFSYLARVASLGFILAIVVPNLLINFASAYGQVQSRSIELTSSAPGLTAAGQNVTYAVQFTTATAGAIEGVVVDFCSNDPIIGDSCTAPTGFTVGATPTTGSTFTGLNPTTASSWTIASLNSGRTFIMSDASASTSIGASTVIDFTITGVTNPTADCSVAATVCTFYARILTYATPGGATGYLAATPSNGGTVTDAGGIALSTANQITITSKVQEELTFCVYTATLDAGNCNSATGTSINLGNNNGVLSTSGPFVDKNTHFDIQTNALHSAVVRFIGPTLTSGSNTIEASATSGTDSGNTAADDDASTLGSPQFGFCAFPAAGATSDLTIAATYASVSAGAGSTYSGASSTCNSDTTQSSNTGTAGGANAGSYFGFNITAAASAYGDTIATDTAGPYVQGTLAFIGNISNTTVAGIYTTTLTFIATGTY